MADGGVGESDELGRTQPKVRELERSLKEADDANRNLSRFLQIAEETITRKNAEYAALVAEASPERSLEVALLRNRSREWEALKSENERLHERLARQRDPESLAVIAEQSLSRAIAEGVGQEALNRAEHLMLERLGQLGAEPLSTATGRRHFRTLVSDACYRAWCAGAHGARQHTAGVA